MSRLTREMCEAAALRVWPVVGRAWEVDGLCHVGQATRPRLKRAPFGGYAIAGGWRGCVSFGSGWTWEEACAAAGFGS